MGPTPTNEPSASRRDDLALRRTSLANERTLLAYVRTGIMLAASGVTLIKLPGSTPTDRTLAAGLLIGAVVVLLFGGRRFRQVKRSL
ncbi:YidH family protein [Botrimarina hoheduenensis]|uniref:DUF202 domain-containing protein n=1 Tax=Botrimarina hoheduenensis TaxID=2528000 RepID=A0A5C5WDR8_9BACT|nr:DUF202 domain-containing protein [Botrimarina hoheduenensis]TWT48844.1 hypothetical protein Pla111_06200 [Botrimarina hoheduenensis]